jgi:hypothetical protein
MVPHHYEWCRDRYIVSPESHIGRWVCVPWYADVLRSITLLAVLNLRSDSVPDKRHN